MPRRSFALSRRRGPNLEKRLKILSILSLVIGAIGVADTIEYYATGSDNWALPAFHFSLTFTWGTLYFSWFVLGLVVAYGLRTRLEFFRIVGLIFAVLVTIAGVVCLILIPPAIAAGGVSIFIADVAFFGVAFIVFGVWSFRVLHGADVRQAFRHDDDRKDLPGRMKEPSEQVPPEPTSDGSGSS